MFPGHEVQMYWARLDGGPAQELAVVRSESSVMREWFGWHTSAQKVAQLAPPFAVGDSDDQ